MQAIHYLASYFPLLAAEKAREHLEKLRDLRDNNIHRSLAALAGHETSFEEAAKLAKVLLSVPIMSIQFCNRSQCIGMFKCNIFRCTAFGSVWVPSVCMGKYVKKGHGGHLLVASQIF